MARFCFSTAHICLGGRWSRCILVSGVSFMQEKVDELRMELDSARLDVEHAQLNARENEAAARALRYYTSRTK